MKALIGKKVEIVMVDRKTARGKVKDIDQIGVLIEEDEERFESLFPWHVVSLLMVRGGD